MDRREPPALLLIIGAQKAGTTFLFRMIEEVDGVVGARGKEGRGLLVRPDSDWKSYQDSTFDKSAASAALLVDATPEYMLAPEIVSGEVVMERAFAVAVLRDPVERIISQFQMRASRLEVQGSLDNQIRQELKYVRQRGGLENWVAEVCGSQRFGPGEPDFIVRSAYHVLLPPRVSLLGQRLMVLSFQDLVSEPDQVARRLLRHVGHSGDIVVPSPVNTSGQARSVLLEIILKRIRSSQRRRKWRLGTGLGQFVERLNRGDKGAVELSADVRSELEAVLHPAREYMNRIVQ